MCSSCAGHQNIVELLLRHNADIEPKDKNGRNASDLALINGHKNIYHLIKNYRNYNRLENRDQSLISNRDNEPIDGNECKRCDVCDSDFRESDVRHLCSIVHQIHCTSDHKCHQFYKISDNNKGFQMMLKNGWNRDLGLGPNGSGMRAPVKTVLKSDRKGLGNVRNKPKITHSFDEIHHKNIVKSNKLSKQTQRKRLESRLKRIEIKFRRDFK